MKTAGENMKTNDITVEDECLSINTIPVGSIEIICQKSMKMTVGDTIIDHRGTSEVKQVDECKNHFLCVNQFTDGEFAGKWAFFDITEELLDQLTCIKVN